jgi:hypothetical protein
MTGPFSAGSKKIPAISCLLVIICLYYFASPTWAQSSPENHLDPQRVAWTHLSYRANTFLGKVTVQVQLTFISACEAQRALIVSPKGIPTPIESPRACFITVHRTVDPTFGSKITETDTVWFNPGEAGALGRSRLRRGNDDFKKVYRFTDHGVYRYRQEPKDQQETSLAPEKWTDVKSNFYTYNMRQLGCSTVSERSILLYVGSAMLFSENRDPLSLCVFGKRQLHRVRLSAAGVQALKVNYKEKSRHNDVARKATVEARKITLSAKPLDSDLNDVENFSFLGLHENIVILIHPASRLPLQISGDVPRLGKIDLKLQQVILK